MAEKDEVAKKMDKYFDADEEFEDLLGKSFLLEVGDGVRGIVKDIFVVTEGNDGRRVELIILKTKDDEVVNMALPSNLKQQLMSVKKGDDLVIIRYADTVSPKTNRPMKNFKVARKMGDKRI